MARINLLKDGYRGKLGDTVGANWRGIDYIRTYAKPRQPDTPAQILHKQNFRRMIQIATMLHEAWLPKIYDGQGVHTVSNQFMTTNKGIFATNGIDYAPILRGDADAVHIAGRNNTITGYSYTTQRYLASGSYDGDVVSLLTLHYCPEAYDQAFWVSTTLPDVITLGWRANWTHKVVYTISQLITTTTVYAGYVFRWNDWNPNEN